MSMSKQKPARLLTNFDVRELPVYQEAIRRFGGRVRRTRMTIGKPANAESLRSLYMAGGRPYESLDKFWAIVDKVRVEQARYLCDSRIATAKATT